MSEKGIVICFFNLKLELRIFGRPEFTVDILDKFTSAATKKGYQAIIPK
jgi:hypothetical protein